MPPSLVEREGATRTLLESMTCLLGRAQMRVLKGMPRPTGGVGPVGPTARQGAPRYSDDVIFSCGHSSVICASVGTQQLTAQEGEGEGDWRKAHLATARAEQPGGPAGRGHTAECFVV